MSHWDAFETAAMPHLNSLFRIAMWRLRNQSEAEDLVQETYTEALRSFDPVARRTRCRTWLVTIMCRLESKRLLGKARLRMVRGEEEQEADTPAFQGPTPQSLTDEGALLALERIPRECSYLILLADVEDMTCNDIADALQLPAATVTSRLTRGRTLWRIEIARYAHADSPAHDIAAEPASPPPLG